MRILIACEFSGIVRNEFCKLGHDAWSCDLLPTEIEGNHIIGNVLDILDRGWDIMIAHPPCTYLTVSGNKWMKPEYRDRFPNRIQQRQEAIEFFLKLYNCDIERVAVENPVGVMSREFRKPDQYIQPYMFGHTATKKTGLWLKNLPLLIPTNTVSPIMQTLPDGKRYNEWHLKRYNNPEERMKARSRTFIGIAKAMAEQWTA